jgi:hypothetical protein
MIEPKSLSVFVIHCTKFHDRREFLESELKKSGLDTIWITEKNFSSANSASLYSNKVLGVGAKKLGMDLGVTSRSLTFSRRKAKLQGYLLLWRSYFGPKQNNYTTGSLPPRKELPLPAQEAHQMHITALRKGIDSKSNWILILEDDVIPITNAFETVFKIVSNWYPRNAWVNLNSGAGLKRTASDPKPNRFGLFRVKPASTKCAAAYLVSRDLAARIIGLVDRYGLPTWLPIDLTYQAALRKCKAKSFWQEPEIFHQGSETGKYKSGFASIRQNHK